MTLITFPLSWSWAATWHVRKHWANPFPAVSDTDDMSRCWKCERRSIHARKKSVNYENEDDGQISYLSQSRNIPSCKTPKVWAWKYILNTENKSTHYADFKFIYLILCIYNALNITLMLPLMTVGIILFIWNAAGSLTYINIIFIFFIPYIL